MRDAVMVVFYYLMDLNGAPNFGIPMITKKY